MIHNNANPNNCEVEEECVLCQLLSGDDQQLALPEVVTEVVTLTDEHEWNLFIFVVHVKRVRFCVLQVCLRQAQTPNSCIYVIFVFVLE